MHHGPVILTTIMAAAMILIGPSARGGGTVEWKEALPVLSQSPELRGHVERTLEVAEAGEAERLGHYFTYLGGRRIAPYQFKARPKESEGDYSLMLTIKADAVFLDGEGKRMEEAGPEALAVREILQGITVSPVSGPASGVVELSEEAASARTEQIRAWYESVQKKAQQFREVKLEASAEPVSGTITWYRGTENIDLVRIESILTMGDHSAARENLYLHHGELFFALVEESSWNFDPRKENATIESITETRFYFDEGGIYKALQKSATAPTKEIDEAIVAAENQAFELNGTEAALYRGRAHYLMEATTPEEVKRAWEFP